MLEFAWLCRLLLINRISAKINQFKECDPELEKLNFTFPLAK